MVKVQTSERWIIPDDFKEGDELLVQFQGERKHTTKTGKELTIFELSGEKGDYVGDLVLSQWSSRVSARIIAEYGDDTAGWRSKVVLLRKSGKRFLMLPQNP